MGKKKRGGGGRKGKGRVTSKDRSSHSGDDQDLLSEELTALCAIFQDDFRIVSDSPHMQFVINLRPHSSDMGYDNPDDVLAHLLVRCLPGYPYKCPKLQIVPKQGLTKGDVDRLLSLLIDQANFNAREGRVMIFNLVEAAQEFLSEIIPLQESQKSVPPVSGSREPWLDGDAAFLSERCTSSDGTFVHGLFDLYSDMSCVSGSWDQGLATDFVNDNHSRITREKTSVTYKSRHEHISYKLGHHGPQLDSFQNQQAGLLHDVDHGKAIQRNINTVQEEVDDSASISANSSSELEPVGKGSKDVENEDTAEKDSDLGEQIAKMGVTEDVSMALGPSLVEMVPGDKSENVKRDLLLVHLLRISSASKGSSICSLTEIASELYNLGMLSEWAKDLAAEPSVFEKAFENVFQQNMISSRISQFWKASADFDTDDASIPKSRYLNDFEEVCSLGHGGFGHVVLCKNKLDGRQYAVKKIRLKDKNLSVNDKILREVATLSRLQHQHVVRYYQAWFETEFGGYHDMWGSMTPNSASFSYMGTSSTNAVESGKRQETTFLYIQMEHCPRTLRQDLETYKGLYDKEATWHLFRQIVEGLAHIHSQGIIHRDLTPSNIFFDARNDIKIGDFGLAKFLKLEQLDQDQMFPSEATGVSMDGTGQVGTLFYTAPEIELGSLGWPQINEKVDMYSLGVVFFELWHPFATGMERHIVLSELKQKGTLPIAWISEFPEQASLVQRLMSPSPSDRPTAMEILRHELPPRMEDEWLDDILRTIQTSEDTYVYDHVVSTIFDEDRIIMKAQRQHSERSKVTQEISLFRQYTELASELRDNAIKVCKEVFSVHGAKRLEIEPMRLFDGYHQFDRSRRNTVKLLTCGGNMLELCHELRSPFISWVVTNQKVNFKRYEISWVHRKAIGHSAPNRFLQGDFDIVGGASSVTMSEIIKVAVDIVNKLFHPDVFDIRLNHAQILEAIWSWVGIDKELRQNVAELLSLMSSSCPQSASRKSIWGFIRRQLLQDHNLPETVVDKLHAVDLRFCGSADQALARLRGALSSEYTRRALEELTDLLSYLRVWQIEEHISLDVLMPPEESYYRGLFFQIYLIKENNPGSVSERTLFAVGGCYDHLLHQMWHHVCGIFVHPSPK